MDMGSRSVLVIVVCGAVSLSACSSDAARQSATHVTATSQRSATGSTSSTTSASPCLASVLSAKTSHQGGGYVGETMIWVTFTNGGSAPCSLSGYPSVSLTRADGSLLETGGPPQAAPQWVTVQPRSTAGLEVYWSNWCSPLPGFLHMDVALPGGGGTVVSPFDDVFAPGCESANDPPRLEVTTAYTTP